VKTPRRSVAAIKYRFSSGTFTLLSSSQQGQILSQSISTAMVRTLPDERYGSPPSGAHCASSMTAPAALLLARIMSRFKRCTTRLDP